MRKQSVSRFAEREIHGVDDRGEAERVVIWIERLPGALWAVGRAVNPQYRRSEEPYSPEDLSAVAYVNWDDDSLYLAVDVAKPDLVFRPAAAPPLRLDNEPDDIHADGVQLYLRDLDGAATIGYLVTPEAGDGRRVRVRGAGEPLGDPQRVRAAWQRTDSGYRLTIAVRWPESFRAHFGGRIGFDLIVNEMLPGRERRAGQLVWSGGNGWVWLQGDRQEPDRFGILELVG